MSLMISLVRSLSTPDEVPAPLSLDRFKHIPMQHRFSMYMSIPLPLTSSPLPPPTMLAYIDMHQADCFIQLLVYNSPPLHRLLPEHHYHDGDREDVCATCNPAPNEPGVPRPLLPSLCLAPSENQPPVPLTSAWQKKIVSWISGGYCANMTGKTTTP